MKDIVSILREAGYGVVEGKEEVIKKIEEIGRCGKYVRNVGRRI